MPRRIFTTGGPAPTTQVPTAEPSGPFDVLDVLAKAEEILRRDILNLMSEGTGKKLSPTSSQALVQYIKLLTELKKDQESALSAMDDDELEKLNGKK